MITDFMKAKKIFSRVLYYIFALFLAFLICVPFFWMVVTSIKTNGAVMLLPVEWIPKQPSLDAYRKLFSIENFWSSVANSFYISVFCTVLRILCAAMAAFALAKIKFRGSKVLFSVFITALMIPPQTTFIPLFIIMGKLNLLNNLNAFLFLQMFNAFAIFMLYQKMQTINDAFIEAATIDGAGMWRIFFQIILPLCPGTLATLAILSFMDLWNDYLLPLVLLTDRANYTLPLILNSMQGQYSNQYNLMMAGSLLSIIPILIVYICAQKYFKEGLTVGGVKG
ncbi:carbohydrate ABC transporter permease [Caproiciproducens galactitolivorans]|uniref:Carbohydrate ABC transporter permease n=1 Tax=Caproiciproducens galactitolivorans TaxID=642589 RepID=A0ABT4BU31_9FIRM|nr:carbohydrate ABC transporter permease [Caproiciproducens galactitolivorans]MCY1714374.1 carbohydrate ABC transporter permease [Caproiciproducens galactitolivorans]